MFHALIEEHSSRCRDCTFVRPRRSFPPRVVWTNCRSVLLASGAGGKLPGSVNCGPQPQVVTQ